MSQRVDTFVVPNCSRCERLLSEFAEYLKSTSLLGKRPNPKVTQPEVNLVEVRMHLSVCSDDGKRVTAYHPEVCRPCSDEIAEYYGGNKDDVGEFERRYEGPMAEPRAHKPLRVRVAPAKNKAGEMELREISKATEWWDRHTESWRPFNEKQDLEVIQYADA